MGKNKNKTLSVFKVEIKDIQKLLVKIKAGEITFGKLDYLSKVD